jgi:hypothetical protein
VQKFIRKKDASQGGGDVREVLTASRVCGSFAAALEAAAPSIFLLQKVSSRRQSLRSRE